MRLIHVIAGLNISTKNTGQKRELNQEVCKVPGFTELQWLLPKHSNIPEVYFLMMALLLGQHVDKLPIDVEVRQIRTKVQINIELQCNFIKIQKAALIDLIVIHVNIHSVCKLISEIEFSIVLTMFCLKICTF